MKTDKIFLNGKRKFSKEDMIEIKGDSFIEEEAYQEGLKDGISKERQRIKEEVMKEIYERLSELKELRKLGIYEKSVSISVTSIDGGVFELKELKERLNKIFEDTTNSKEISN